MFRGLALVVAAGLLGPVLAMGRRPIAPVLVGELIAGVALGRTGFGFLDPALQPLPAFSALGFAMLMLSAGSDVDIASTDLRRSFLRGGAALLIALAAGVPLGLLVATGLRVGHPELFVILIAGSSAAIAFPIFEERRLAGRAVALLIVWITLADALTALLMPLTIVGSAKIPGALVGDALIVVVATVILFAGERLAPTGRLREAYRESRQRGWALRLRLSVLLLLVLAAIAERTGGSLLVAGFAAGVVLRRFREPNRLALQLSGLANGFFVPAFFVLLGATLDLRQLLADPAAIALSVAMPVASVVVHLVAAAIAGRERRIASGLLASAQLGLPAAAASLGLGGHSLSPAVAGALVTGGVLTMIPAAIGAALLPGGRPPGGASRHPTMRGRSIDVTSAETPQGG